MLLNIWLILSNEDNIAMLFDMCKGEDGKACVKSFFEVTFT